jgi:hypothetical protein
MLRFMRHLRKADDLCRLPVLQKLSNVYYTLPYDDAVQCRKRETADL